MPKAETEPVLNNFSSAYTAFFLYFVLVLISSKRNLGVFIRLGSLGAIFVTMFVIGIVVLGIFSWYNTEYQIGTTEDNQLTKWDLKNLQGIRTVVLFTANFAPLASLLNIGFFLHTMAVPILKHAKHPENNTRNLFVGYTIVFISYMVIGAVGYFSFIGTTFKNYFTFVNLTPRSGEIN